MENEYEAACSSSRETAHEVKYRQAFRYEKYRDAPVSGLDLQFAVRERKTGAVVPAPIHDEQVPHGI